MSDVEDHPAHTSDEVPDTDEDGPARKLRRAADRAAERKRKAEKEEKERKEKAEAAKMPKQSKQFQKVLKDIQKKEEEIAECEREIAVIDNDLREADCPRTRVLGKDRFWNRYYWFERNGMPYGGLPDSSTASAGYANGCIWVQGPDELERVGYIDMEPQWQDEYKAKFGMTVPERKKMEEGPTSVFNAHQWGYYDDPEAVDELVNYRDKIVTNMKNRKAYLNPEGEEKDKENGEKDKNSENNSTPAPAQPSPPKRMTTRARGIATIAAPPREPEPEPAKPKHYRCMNWENTMAIEEIGHLHSVEPPPTRSRKMTKKKEAAVKEKEAEQEMMVTRGKKGRQSTGR
jgi:hypothetical protein